MKSELHKCSILVVEDDEDLCTILRLVITNKCILHFEHTLTNAENYLHVEIPDVVLLDNNLPDGLGVGFIKPMLELYPALKIVLMTADTTIGLNNRALHEGATQFISKPFAGALINKIIYSLCPELLES